MYLQNTTYPEYGHVVRPQGGGTQPQQGSVRDIGAWLNKYGGKRCSKTDDMHKKPLFNNNFFPFFKTSKPITAFS